MNPVEQGLLDIKAEFEEFQDSFDRYSYLVELAALLPPLKEEFHTEDRLVKGCQSHVWLNIHPEDGKFYFESDSDTLIIKGVLLLLSDLLNEAAIKDVASAKVDLLPLLGLGSSFSDARQKGIASAIQMLQDAAKNAL